MIQVYPSRKLNYKLRLWGLTITDLLAVFGVGWMAVIVNDKRLGLGGIAAVLASLITLLLVRQKSRLHIIRDFLKTRLLTRLFKKSVNARKNNSTEKTKAVLFFSFLIAVFTYFYLGILLGDTALKFVLATLSFLISTVVFQFTSTLELLLQYDFQSIFDQKGLLTRLSNGYEVLGLRFKPFDLESVGENVAYHNALQVLASAPDFVQLRFIGKVLHAKSIKRPEQRAEAVLSVGVREYDSFLFIEVKKPTEEQRTQISYYLDTLLDVLVSPSTLEPFEIERFLPPQDEFLQIEQSFISSSKRVISVIKLHNLAGAESLPFQLSVNLLQSLPSKTEMVTLIKKAPRANIVALLSQQSKQAEQATSLVESKKYVAVQEAISEVAMKDKEYFIVESNIVIEAESYEKARKLTQMVLKEAQKVALFSEDPVGQIASFMSSRVGSPPHLGTSVFLNVFEDNLAIPLLLPIFSFGNGHFPVSNSGLLVHRASGAIDSIDTFSGNSYSAIVLAKTGMGKSVLMNQLVKSYLNDPNTQVMIIDVKGSFLRMTEEYHGSIFNISLDQSCGLNPLSRLKTNASNEALEIVSEFIKGFLVEEGEERLSREMSAEVSQLLYNYAHSDVSDYSLAGFLKASETLPRKALLKPWVSGAKKEVFKEKDETLRMLENRLCYFNLTELSTATAGGVAKSIVNSVLVEYFFRLLEKSAEKRIVLICDETPVFIQECFETFKILTNNVRKLNGGLILSAQRAEGLISKSDHTLIEQAETKIIFNTQKNDEFMESVLGLKPEAIEFLKAKENENTDEFAKKDYSSFYVKKAYKSYVGFLRLTAEELYESTTNPKHLERIEKVSKALEIDRLTASKFIAQMEDGL